MSSGFIHRRKSDGAVDSICLRCFRTIASNNHETALAAAEARHECEPADLIRLQGWVNDRARVNRSTKSGRLIEPPLKRTSGQSTVLK